MKAFELIKHNQQIAVLCDNHPVDLDKEISEDQPCQAIDFNHPLGKDVYWHTSAHILAHAVLNLFPGTKLGVGPAVEEGFYYDFIPPRPFTPEDLENIEQEMKKIIKEDIEIHRFEKTTAETIDLLKEQQQELKIELIENFQEPFSFYQQGNFCDLCRGPHLRSTGEVKAIKLLSVAAAYWKGDEKNKSMQRIYGVSFPSKKIINYIICCNFVFPFHPGIFSYFRKIFFEYFFCFLSIKTFFEFFSKRKDHIF